MNSLLRSLFIEIDAERRSKDLNIQFETKYSQEHNFLKYKAIYDHHPYAIKTV